MGSQGSLSPVDHLHSLDSGTACASLDAHTELRCICSTQKSESTLVRQAPPESITKHPPPLQVLTAAARSYVFSRKELPAAYHNRLCMCLSASSYS